MPVVAYGNPVAWPAAIVPGIRTKLTAAVIDGGCAILAANTVFDGSAEFKEAAKSLPAAAKKAVTIEPPDPVALADHQYGSLTDGNAFHGEVLVGCWVRSLHDRPGRNDSYHDPNGELAVLTRAVAACLHGWEWPSTGAGTPRNLLEPARVVGLVHAPRKGVPGWGHCALRLRVALRWSP